MPELKLSSYLGQFANTMQNTSQAVLGVSDTIYKLDAENIYKNKATEIGLGIEQFKDSLRTDTDFGIPDSEQPTGYMQKWKDYIAKAKSNIQTITNPLARRELEGYIGQLEISEGSKISDLQFAGWGKQQIADARTRISAKSKTGETAQVKLEYAHAEITSLAKNGLINPGDVDTMLEAETQKILFDDAKRQVITDFQTNGWGSAITLAANLAGASYAVGDKSVVLDPQSLGTLTSVANLLSNAAKQSKDQQLNTALLNLIEGKDGALSLDLIRQINPEDVPGWIAKYDAARKTGEGKAGEDEYFTYDADIEAGKPFDRAKALASTNMTFSMKNALIQSDATAKKDDVLFALGKSYDNFAALSLGKAVIDPSAPTLSPTYLNSLEGKIDPQVLSSYRTAYWNMVDKIDAKAKNDTAMAFTAKILRGEVSREEILANPENMTQNFSLYLSVQAGEKQDAQDTAGIAVFSGIAQLQKKAQKGEITQADLDAMGKTIEESKDKLGLSLYASANNSYLSIYSTYTQTVSATNAVQIKSEIAANPEKFTFEGIFQRKDITDNDKVNLASYLGTLIPQNEADKLTKDGLKLADNLDRALKGLPITGNVLDAKWLEANKDRLTPQIYSALQSSLTKFEADAALTATKDSLNNAVFAYRDTAYATGEPNPTKREALNGLIDKAKILAPEERAAYKEKLATIDVNAEALAQQREDQVYQAIQRERTLGIQAKSDAQDTVDAERQTKATEIFTAFSAKIGGLQGKDAEDARNQAVRDIIAVYASDPVKASTFTHNADVLYAIQSNAEYNALDIRARNAMDEYIKVQTVKGYVHDPSVEMMSEGFIKTLFPSDSANDNKFSTYWKDKFDGFNSSTTAMAAQEAPALKELQDAKANSWAAINGIGYDSGKPVLNQVMLDSFTNLSPAHYREASDDLINIGNAISAKQAAANKAANGEGPTPTQKATANSRFDLLSAVAESVSNQRLSNAAPSTIKYVDEKGKEITVTATPELFNTLLSAYSADLIAGGKFSDALALNSKITAKVSDPIWSDVEFARKALEKDNKWSPQMTAWIDGIMATHPNPRPEQMKDIIDQMKTKSISLNVGADWTLLTQTHDVSETYLENAKAGKYSLFMTQKDGKYQATHPAFKDPQATFAAKSLKEINSVLKLTGKPELKDFTQINNPDGTVSYSVKTGTGKTNMGDTFYLGLYDGNALVMKESQGAAFVYIPWQKLEGAEKWGMWASVVFDTNGNARRSNTNVSVETNSGASGQKPKMIGALNK